MNRRHWRLAGACALALAVNPAAAGNAMRGEDLAKRWCSGCHVVSAGQKQALADAPSFRSVARRAEFNVRSLSYWLLAPHPPMPNFSLTRDEANDLASYIATLK